MPLGQCRKAEDQRHSLMSCWSELHRCSRGESCLLSDDPYLLCECCSFYTGQSPDGERCNYLSRDTDEHSLRPNCRLFCSPRYSQQSLPSWGRSHEAGLRCCCCCSSWWACHGQRMDCHLQSCWEKHKQSLHSSFVFFGRKLVSFLQQTQKFSQTSPLLLHLKQLSDAPIIFLIHTDVSNHTVFVVFFQVTAEKKIRPKTQVHISGRIPVLFEIKLDT